MGLKEDFKFKNLAWLMPSISVPSILERLGIENYQIRGNEIHTFCPDHHLFVKRESSDPNWWCNMDSGETFCFTEGRGSNIVYTVARLKNCKREDALQWMVGNDVDLSSIKFNSVARSLERLKGREKPKPKKEGFDPSNFDKEINKPFVFKSGYDYFETPTGKLPTNITKATVDHFKCFQRQHGYYADRVFIPYFMKGELVGFSAIDILGKKEWLKRKPTAEENEYKKTLYPKGFARTETLFNYDGCEVGADYIIITEGARETMKLWQFGFKNNVSMLGIHFSTGQIRLLSELAPKKVLIMLDGDEAGYEATKKLEKSLKDFFDVRGIIVPYGKDPKNLSSEKIELLIQKALNK